MIEILGYSFGLFEIIFWLVLSMGILARIVWYTGLSVGRKWYFPEILICRLVHNNLPVWSKTARNLFSKHPRITVLGFVLTPIWFLLVGLNILLLAQVLEVFFGAGKRITLIPWVGSYAVFTLVLGILYAVSETVLAVLYDHLKSKSTKILLLMVIGIMIVAESGLAYYRAWLISTGNQMLSPSLWDTVMYRVGPFLAALIGLCVPISETFTGKYSFQEFIEGIIEASVRWVGGVMVGIWCVLNYLLFGFHRIHPGPPESDGYLGRLTPTTPRWLKRLMRRFRSLKLKGDSLNTIVMRLYKRSRSLPDLPKSVEQLRNDLCSLQNGDTISISALREKGHQGQTLIEDRLILLKDYSQQEQLRTRIEDYKRTVQNESKVLRLRANLIVAQMNRAPRIFKKRQRAIRRFNRPLIRAEKKRLTLIQLLLDLENQLQDVSKVYTMPDLPINQVNGNINNVVEGLLEKISVTKGSLFEAEHQIAAQKIELVPNPYTDIDFTPLVNDMLGFMKNDLSTLAREQHARFRSLSRMYRAKSKDLHESRSHWFLPWTWRRNEKKSQNADVMFSIPHYYDPISKKERN
jgi:hypothetical protein